MVVKLVQMIGVGLFVAALVGCGTTKSQRAREQLLMSDAVDRSVASIDFRPLSGRHVFLDTTYAKNIKSDGFVNPDYIISSVRQQMMSTGCLLVESRDTAEYIAELRIGALSTDVHDVVYGLPANNALNSAASLVAGAPAIPIIPEISVARKNDEEAAAKIAIFAYHRESRRPVWQSGVAQARSRAKDTWILGAGPFQSGSIHEGTAFVGGGLPIPLLTGDNDDVTGRADPLANYTREATFLPAPSPEADVKRQEVQPASYTNAQPPAPAVPAATATPPPAAAPVPAPAPEPSAPVASPPGSAVGAPPPVAPNAK